MSTTTIERRNGNYILTDNGVESIINAITTDGKSLILPENASGRKFFALSKFEKSELHELNAINRDTSAERPTSRKSLLEYMTPEDKALYDAIMERAKAAREEANKKVPLTEEQKLRNRLAKLQAQLDKLMDEEAEA
jgi:hypothetical protein